MGPSSRSDDCLFMFGTVVPNYICIFGLPLALEGKLQRQLLVLLADFDETIDSLSWLVVVGRLMPPEKRRLVDTLQRIMPTCLAGASVERLVDILSPTEA
jgi:hypothetical protein